MSHVGRSPEPTIRSPGDATVPNVQSEIERARQRLLDLTMRNRLLNHHPSRQTSLELLNRDLDLIHQHLVLEEHVARFRGEGRGRAGAPKPEPEDADTDAPEIGVGSPLEDDEAEDVGEDASTEMTTPEGDAKPVPPEQPNLLLCAESDEVTRGRLRKMHQKAVTFIEEQGCNVLFLALGFLEWREPRQPEPRRAPLLLVPVELKRGEKQAAYTLRWTGEDILPNASLAAKVKEYHVHLPDLPAEDEPMPVSAYLREVSKAIEVQREWRVIVDAWIDFFSFTKYVMYVDLGADSWHSGKHPLVGAVLDPGSNGVAAATFDETEVDQRLPAKDTYAVLDADPSQIAVTQNARLGHNLVVEGPPGTGKSQTIVNCIAELLADGKSVLFVSEKLAALEVVKSRLDNVGLGDYCLELHSRKANKRDVLEEIRRTLELGPPRSVDLDADFEEIEALKAELNKYAEALATPLAPGGWTAFDMFGLRERATRHFESVGRTPPPLSINGVEKWERKQYNEARQALTDLIPAMHAVSPVGENPWRQCAPRGPATPLFREDVVEGMEVLRRYLRDLDAAVRTLPRMDEEAPGEFLDSVGGWIVSMNSPHTDIDKLLRRFKREELPVEVISVLDEYAELCRESWPVLNRRYRIMRGTIHRWAKAVEAVVKDLVQHRAWLMEQLGVSELLVREFDGEPLPLERLRHQLGEWHQALDSLDEWVRFTSAREACQATGAAPLGALLEKGELADEDATIAFETRFADQLLRVAFKAYPGLAGFDPRRHGERVRRFQELDRRLIAANRQRLAARLHAERPRLNGLASSGSEMGVLRGELNKKRNHLPVRALLTRTGRLIQQLKPCFMMSPLSVANFLDPGAMEFDVVIFDEASQVKPEDALGALFRGKQAIVMGDTRQLPPTSFFDNLVDDAPEAEEDDDGMASITEVESILHQCRRGFLEKMLRWHYRSRHESLIAVPNREFYGNRLLIYPSSDGDREGLGLRLRYLPESVYDRGKGSVNRIEARAVAEAVLEHFRKTPDRSLGVGTFSVKQRDAILDELEAIRHSNAELDRALTVEGHERFFVKNLETIQGDERDVILISVGYGFDADRRLTYNFGPLSNEGGERRLNVLATRARERCVVFVNFRADELKLDGVTSQGVHALQAFLKYAETGYLEETSAAGDDAEPGFEESVRAFLEEHGYEVHSHVGCAGFRIDLAVADPAQPGHYAIGIQCDGATYSSSRVARERDRLRQEILERYRGWTLCGVWSTDWYRSREKAGEALLAAVREAIEASAADAESRRGEDDDVADAVPPEDTAAPAGDAPEATEEPGAEPESPDEPADEEEPDVNGIPEETVITREEPAEEEPAPGIEERLTPYVQCEDLGVPIDPERQLHEHTPEELAAAVAAVVSVEGPVHAEDIIQRVRNAVGTRPGRQQNQNRSHCGHQECREAGLHRPARQVRLAGGSSTAVAARARGAGPYRVRLPGGNRGRARAGARFPGRNTARRVGDTGRKVPRNLPRRSQRARTVERRHRRAARSRCARHARGHGRGALIPRRREENDVATWRPTVPLPWTDSDLESIERDALRVLGEIGVECKHPDARRVIAERAGVTIRGDRVCFAEQPLRDHLAERRASAQQPERNTPFALGGCYATLAYCDPETQAVRPATTAEATRMARLWDARGLAGTLPVAPGDVHPALATVEAERICLENSHYLGGKLTVTDPDLVPHLCEMNAAVGRRYHLVEQIGISPLRFNGEGLLTALRFADRADMDVSLDGFIPMAGATVPLDPRSAIVQSSAETIAFDFVCAKLNNDGGSLITTRRAVRSALLHHRLRLGRVVPVSRAGTADEQAPFRRAGAHGPVPQCRQAAGRAGLARAHRVGALAGALGREDLRRRRAAFRRRGLQPATGRARSRDPRLRRTRDARRRFLPWPGRLRRAHRRRREGGHVHRRRRHGGALPRVLSLPGDLPPLESGPLAHRGPTLDPRRGLGASTGGDRLLDL